MSDPNISPDGQWKWNGTEWVSTQAGATFEPVPAPKKKGGKGWWIAAGVAAVIGIFGVIGSFADTGATPEPEATVSAIETVVPEPPVATPTEEPVEEPTEPAEEPTEAVIDEPTEAAEAPAKSDHESLTSREFAKLVKDPDAHVGENVIVYAEVTQFDAATGDEAFRGSVTSDKQEDTDYYWIDGENAFFEGDADLLADVVAEDVVKVWVTVGGSYSYDTQNGGSTTVPSFLVNHIDVIGSVD